RDRGGRGVAHAAAPGRSRSGRRRARRRRARDRPTYSRAQMAPIAAPNTTHGASTIRSLPDTAVAPFLPATGSYEICYRLPRNGTVVPGGWNCRGDGVKTGIRTRGEGA